MPVPSPHRKPNADDATLPLPAKPTGATPAPEDATLPSPPPDAPTPVSGVAPDDQAATLQFPSPADATLDPNDPRARAYREAAQRAAREAAGTKFGDYQLLEPIARGGMGVVYKARQRKLNRIVAIKMILAGQFADDTDVQRFYAEAEAAAALSHPNIVAIHEIGEVDGQHFFSMDYIEGQSLAALVQESPLPPRRAAELLATIAEAVQFAHDRGIVHRDLKPSNILLDASQRPLITDFGLAKQVTGQSQLTMSGAIVGTPSYMPPEQAAGKGDEVGPWSDLYSLGAILYEMLTGRPPFRAATPFETIRQVLHTEPLSPRLVNPGVPRDLETICLKCLQKERSRRYASPQELADELRRFLRGEPIQARPIGQLGRLWRWCRRNPITASAIAAVQLMLVVTALATSYSAIRMMQASAIERQSLRDQMQAVNDLFTEVSENTLLNQPGLQPVRRELLEKALAYYQRFLTQRANDPTLQDELASTFFRVGLITEALESPDHALTSYETARQMQADLLAQSPNDPERLEAYGNTLNALGNVRVKQKQYALARDEYQQAVWARTQLSATDPSSSEYQRVLANTFMNLGLAEYNAGDYDAARIQFEQAQQIREAALQRNPGDEKLRRDLAKGFYNLGNLDWLDGRDDDAAQHFQRAVAIFEELTTETSELDNERLLAICYRILGDLMSDAQPDQARRWYQQSLDRLRPLARQNPDVVVYQTEQAGALMNLAYLEGQVGNHAAAREALQAARDLLAPLVDRFPTAPDYQRDLAVTLRTLAWEQNESGDHSAAAENKQQAIRILADLVQRYPHVPEYAAQLKDTEAVTIGPTSP
jgi:serine/threonine protein kinase